MKPLVGYDQTDTHDVENAQTHNSRRGGRETPEQESTSDIERRIGIDPIDGLLGKRWRLVLKVADLRARFGPGGVGEALRKVELSKIKGLIRAQALRDKRRINNEQVDEEAHASAEYIEFLTAVTLERSRWAKLEEAISDVDFRLYRGQSLARYAASEARL